MCHLFVRAVCACYKQKNPPSEPCCGVALICYIPILNFSYDMHMYIYCICVTVCGSDLCVFSHLGERSVFSFFLCRLCGSAPRARAWRRIPCGPSLVARLRAQRGGTCGFTVVHFIYFSLTHDLNKLVFLDRFAQKKSERRLTQHAAATLND